MGERRQEMLELRERLIQENPGKESAAELAPLFGDLEREYWAWQLDNYFAELMGEPE